MWWQAGFPLLAGIFYQIIGWLGLYIIPAICGVATAYLAAITFGLMIPNQPSLKILVLLVTGLATPIAFYSTMFWEHTLTTCGAMAATYFLLRGQYTNDQRWYYFAGISAALAVFFRVEVILLLAGFGVGSSHQKLAQWAPFWFQHIGCSGTTDLCPCPNNRFSIYPGSGFSYSR
jgi:hypothetical protein